MQAEASREAAEALLTFATQTQLTMIFQKGKHEFGVLIPVPAQLKLVAVCIMSQILGVRTERGSRAVARRI